MSSLLLTAPAVEPLSLTEAKAFLWVEHSDDDELIAALAACRPAVRGGPIAAGRSERRRSDPISAAAEIHPLLRDRDRADHGGRALSHRRKRVNRAVFLGVLAVFAAIAGFLVCHSDKLI